MSIDTTSDPIADEARRRAATCRALADELDHAIISMRGILAPAEAGHTRAVWDSAAADASRRRLATADADLQSTVGDLTTLVATLQRAAADADAAAAAWVTPPVGPATA